jgi:hypothetical protein
MLFSFEQHSYHKPISLIYYILKLNFTDTKIILIEFWLINIENRHYNYSLRPLIRNNQLLPHSTVNILSLRVVVLKIGLVIGIIILIISSTVV